LSQQRSFFLIDDDPDDQEIFGMVLKELDETIGCDFASDGIQAINRLKVNFAFKPNYILIDLNMPRMNGLDCLKEIKKLQHLNDSKVFIYSTSAVASVIDQSKELGADDFIQKPAAVSALKEIISNIMKS
jgi:CheY-like chemotaxis protein